MNGTATTTDTTAKRRDDRRVRTSSKPPIRAVAMTCLVLITVATAHVTGDPALPFTMPGRAFAEPVTVIGAAHGSPPASVRTATRVT